MVMALTSSHDDAGGHCSGVLCWGCGVCLGVLWLCVLCVVCCVGRGSIIVDAAHRDAPSDDVGDQRTETCGTVVY